ncbi:GNAT family N-acetyltransferase [Aquimarina gracilis]|uniref:GNAT family N-acetyltransferase n=1 Tax=Aquimarina gracilis TaxID=874422 RepID=A0ABU5ZXV6_9FLAO|nr:GNAT family N-acetyltransferase [Aquimarina gracilis]MEB3346691.1 GNAT family N-acetyltransferase [Aquimarina gracilis]
MTKMTVKKLSNVPFDELLSCFLLAFENYYVKMPTDKNYYEQRWKAAKVDFNLSYGMFDEEKLVGFIIHAVDYRNGILTAFNTGTGVIPKYRGKRIVKSIYDYALRDLKQNSIEKSTLEVITKNEIAIRAYKSIGFDISKEYKCFNGVIKIENPHQVELKEVDLKNIVWKNLPNQELYSWDNQKETILEGTYKFYHVINNEVSESFFIVNTNAHYLAQFGLLQNKNGGWDRLFSAIKEKSSKIKINNVDERLKEKIDYLTSIGLENPIDQYEMELSLR